MYSNTYNNEKFINVRSLIENNQFEKAYQFLKDIKDKCALWYYLNGVSAMNIGYYEEGEDSIKKASTMEPENKEYQQALENFNFYRDDYRDRSHKYNRRRRGDLDGCCCCCGDCCCCCGDDCCSDCASLWCLDSCCECCGGDLITCF
ncbi:MAG: hypothetical protein ACRC3Y_12660 [Romboutsia sp.]|uniref:hypothetical protein n=1 Tax=Romboutsia sp. TaxID=1965302 RepID=UPI003F346FAC